MLEWCEDCTAVDLGVVGELNRLTVYVPVALVVRNIAPQLLQYCAVVTIWLPIFCG